MAPTDYDQVAPTYDRRYERNRYVGIEDTLRRFAGNTARRIPEVGCGALARHSTSQLSELTDEAYAAGLAAIEAAATAADAHGAGLLLRVRLQLFATVAGT